LHRDAWKLPELFAWLQQQGGVTDSEMHRVFNCGIGMVVIVPAAQASQISIALKNQGETVYNLGEIRECALTDPQTVVE